MRSRTTTSGFGPDPHGGACAERSGTVAGFASQQRLLTAAEAQWQSFQAPEAVDATSKSPLFLSGSGTHYNTPNMNAQYIQTTNQADQAYQKEILQGVSRTFALTIPQLPGPLYHVVGNAYLLCRIVDTIEDDKTLAAEDKRDFAEQFTAVVAGSETATEFAKALHPLLWNEASHAERDLVANTAAVIRVTHSFNPRQRVALSRCVKIMAEGMARYQDAETLNGLEDLADMDSYCYYAAGVVGEMLTELFCDYSEDINRHQTDLLQLAVSFGQGLQMTNILKDIWEDHRRGACWLPRDIFRRHNVDIRELAPGKEIRGFGEGLSDLIGVARAHLANALRYTLMIPSHEKGIRRFCLWTIGMAVLTLSKINAHRNFSSGQEVKISRRSVKATVLLTNLSVSNDKLLDLLFNLAARRLPEGVIHEKFGALPETV